MGNIDITDLAARLSLQEIKASSMGGTDKIGKMLGKAFDVFTVFINTDVHPKKMKEACSLLKNMHTVVWREDRRRRDIPIRTAAYALCDVLQMAMRSLSKRGNRITVKDDKDAVAKVVEDLDNVALWRNKISKRCDSTKAEAIFCGLRKVLLKALNLLTLLIKQDVDLEELEKACDALEQERALSHENDKKRDNFNRLWQYVYELCEYLAIVMKFFAARRKRRSMSNGDETPSLDATPEQETDEEETIDLSDTEDMDPAIVYELIDDGDEATNESTTLNTFDGIGINARSSSDDAEVEQLQNRSGTAEGAGETMDDLMLDIAEGEVDPNFALSVADEERLLESSDNEGNSDPSTSDTLEWDIAEGIIEDERVSSTAHADTAQDTLDANDEEVIEEENVNSATTAEGGSAMDAVRTVDEIIVLDDEAEESSAKEDCNSLSGLIKEEDDWMAADIPLEVIEPDGIEAGDADENDNNIVKMEEADWGMFEVESNQGNFAYEEESNQSNEGDANSPLDEVESIDAVMDDEELMEDEGAVYEDVNESSPQRDVKIEEDDSMMDGNDESLQSRLLSAENNLEETKRLYRDLTGQEFDPIPDIQESLLNPTRPPPIKIEINPDAEIDDEIEEEEDDTTWKCCDLCCERSRKSLYMKVHREQHFAPWPQDKPGQHRCRYCPSTFAELSNLKGHMYSTNKLHKCGVCYKGWHLKTELIVHQKFFHKKKSLFECSLCALRCGDFEFLKLHRELCNVDVMRNELDRMKRAQDARMEKRKAVMNEASKPAAHKYGTRRAKKL